MDNVLNFERKDKIQVISEALKTKKFIVYFIEEIEDREIGCVYIGEGFNYKDRLFAVDTIGRCLLEEDE